ncbi:MAG: LytTR family transcriptional regulator [Eubacterium sp.]|nr:LytTR family transcriptional regulator [Eubacterium sp.]MDD7210700.1 LytTR family DNA-binding domain-containing protein [Lachnospiraceae bacterium]
MNIGILEYDEKVAYQLGEIIAQECPHVQIKRWDKESELKEDIRKGGIYKILFLALEKNPMDIVEYSKRLQELHPNVKIIYMTELNPTIFEVFCSNPTYILSRPLNEGHVRKALRKALKELSLSREKNFTVINKQGIFTIPYTRIFYVESDKRKLNIYGSDGLIKSINLKISDFLKYEHGHYFMQCHKSYAVNLMHVLQLEKYEIVLENGEKLPISQSRYMETKARYLDYLENE